MAFLQCFPIHSSLADVIVLHAPSQKRTLSHVISLTVNYRLHIFAHSDVSYRFSGQTDNVI